MPTQNIGTLVTSAIRPTDDTIKIASAYGNEIKGGHHAYATLSERNAIIEPRREWGMLCTVYNDGTNNKTYQLVYNNVDTNINNNNNWITYNPSGTSPNSEWVESVLSIVSSPPSNNPGDRFLVTNTLASGPFSSNENKIAYTNNGTSWLFITPTNGMTLRVDDTKNIIFKYQGTYPSGIWCSEVLNSVRYLVANSNDGLTYTSISGSYSNYSTTTLGDYSTSVYYVNFATANSGTASLSIDGLSALLIKKITSGSLSNLSSGDLIPGLEYGLIYNSDGNCLQTVLPNDSSNTIGTPTDTTYTDGLFPFTPTTLVSDAVDNMNQVLKALAPPSAPQLSSWSATGSFVTGKISFDNSDIGFSGATGSAYGSVAKGGTFTASGYRLGITSRWNQPVSGSTYWKDITGILNSSVLSSTTTPTPAYITYSFGYGMTGTMSLFLNGITVSSVGLTSGITIDTTSSGATSGLNLSAATSSKFPSGYTFDTFMNRTGTWTIKRDNSNILNGFNSILVRHDLPTTSYILNTYEFIADGSTSSVISSSPALGLFNTPNRKYLSGIQFYTSPISFVYNVTLDNMYSNTYVAGNAITYNDVTNSLTTSTFSFTTNSSYPSFTSSVVGTQLTTPTTPTSQVILNMTYSNVSGGIRRIGQSIGVSINAFKTVQGSFLNIGTASSSNWMIDTFTATSTSTVEDFNDENYRMQNNSNKYSLNYDNTTEIITKTWSSVWSLRNTPSAQNGLQVINGQLVYPNFDFSSVGSGSASNPNWNNLNTSYTINNNDGFGTGISDGYRTYTRYFNFGTTNNYQNFKLKITWGPTNSSVNFVNSSTSLTNNTDVWVELKLPYQNGSGTPNAGLQTVTGGASGSVTGWMDATKQFVSGSYLDGSGCLNGTSAPTTSGSDWNLTFGVQGTLWTGGYLMFRITSGPYWKGYIDKIEIIPS